MIRQLTQLILTDSADQCQNQSCYRCGRTDVWLQMWLSGRPAEQCQVLLPCWWKCVLRSPDTDRETQPVGEKWTFLSLRQHHRSLLRCQGGQTHLRGQGDVLVWGGHQLASWWYQGHTAECVPRYSMSCHSPGSLWYCDCFCCAQYFRMHSFCSHSDWDLKITAACTVNDKCCFSRTCSSFLNLQFLLHTQINRLTNITTLYRNYRIITTTFVSFSKRMICCPSTTAKPSENHTHYSK